MYAWVAVDAIGNNKAKALKNERNEYIESLKVHRSWRKTECGGIDTSRGAEN